MFDPAKFAKTISYLRMRVKWSMDYAARECGISAALWHKLEYKKVPNPTIRTITRIANVFGLSIDDLIGRKNPQTKPEKAEALPSFFLNHDFHKLK